TRHVRPCRHHQPLHLVRLKALCGPGARSESVLASFHVPTLPTALVGCAPGSQRPIEDRKASSEGAVTASSSHRTSSSVSSSSAIAAVTSAGTAPGKRRCRTCNRERRCSFFRACSCHSITCRDLCMFQ